LLYALDIIVLEKKPRPTTLRLIRNIPKENPSPIATIL